MATPTPPNPGYQPPYPQQPYPPQYPPGGPLKKKTSPVVWILGILGGLFLLFLIAIFSAGWFVMHKVKQAGVDTDLMRRNPTAATIKMMAALNPNIEVLSMNEGSGVVTVRDKQSGKTYTVNFEDAKKGHFTVQEDGKKTVDISASGSGDAGSMQIKTDDGTFNLGGGDAKIPAWIPEYPGSKPKAAYTSKAKDGDAGSFTFQTGDSTEKVINFYKDQFASNGMKVTNEFSGSSAGQGHGGMMTVEGGEKTASVMLGNDGNGTSVTVTYSSKK